MHLMQYVLIIGGLAVVNLVSGLHYLWFVWPALGWGIGVVTHGLSVFARAPFFTGEWERREVEKYLGRKL